ncbi:PiggyBac transposable element-derived protein 4 [Dictyocoela muelleri]|nr:PiggyBac transposable element-derived protein 4 [Dictyocoela muelleri]
MNKYYPLKRKTNRWTQKFTVHILELLLHNSYVLYKMFSKEKPVSHYDFIELIITYLIKKSKISENDNTEETPRKRHLPIKQSKRHYCKNCFLVYRTRSTTSIMCKKCNVNLCTSPCFYS